jgi:hypothetical protein
VRARRVFRRSWCSECAGICISLGLAGFPDFSPYSFCSTKSLFRMGLAGKPLWTGDSVDLAAQVLLFLALKEAVPKHDLYSHPMFSTLRSLPVRPADWSLVSPFLNPITYVSFERWLQKWSHFSWVAGNQKTASRSLYLGGGVPGGPRFHSSLAFLGPHLIYTDKFVTYAPDETLLR